MERRIRILLVEDDQIDRMAFERFVRREGLPYDYVTAGSVAEAREILVGARFDVVLIDYLLGDGTAFDLLGEIEDSPTIVITGSGDEEIAVQAMKAGAYDYLIKDPDGNYLKTLPVTVEGAIRRQRDQEELRRYREQLEALVEERTAELTHANERLVAEIAERRQAEDELRASRDYLDRILNGMYESVIVIDRDYKIVDLNDCALRTYNRTREEAIGKTCHEITHRSPHPCNSAQCVCPLAHVFETGEPLRLEHEHYDHSGAEIILELYAFPLTNATGKVEQVVEISHDVTERVRAEEGQRKALAEALEATQALRESEERYRALFDRTLYGIYLHDFEGRFLDANEAALNLLGYAREDILSLDFASLLEEDQLPQALQSLTEIMQTGSQEAPDEYRLRRKDGAYVWVETEASLIYRQGKPYAIHGLARDITERVQAEEALRESEEKYRHLVEAANAAIFALDPDGVFLFMNSIAAQQAGGQPEDFVGKMMVDVFPPEVAERQIASVREIIRSGQGRVRENETILQGESRWYRTHGQPLCDDAGNIYAAMFIGTDITDRVRAEAALRESEGRYRLLAENVTDVIWTMDMNLRSTYTSPSVLRLRGYSAEEAMAQTLEETLTPASLEVAMEALEEELAIENMPQNDPFRTRALELEVIRKDGSTVWTEARMILLRDLDGRPVGILGVTRDITERVRMEQELRQQERLAAVGQLAGGIAHDFNNLLTTIMLYAQMGLGKERDLTPDLTRALETILEESRQAAKLVQQVLDFSRRSPMETQPVDLESFIEEVVRVLQRTIPESISLLLEVEAEKDVAPLTVDADPTRIQQVLMNLAINARDAMPEGGTLRIGLSRVEASPDESLPWPETDEEIRNRKSKIEDQAWICLAVSDTGAGIPPDALPHIFEPFFTTKEPGRGTGLGLAQVYGIVTQHGGHIGVETEVGRGTTFRVYLPAYREAEDEVPQEEAQAAPQGQGETVLLVEDNEKLREIAQGILDSLGYRVLTAANGREALAVYRSAEGAGPGQGQRVDLVLTDVVMPEMGGAELIRELRKTDLDLKALAITGYLLAEDLEALKAAGILDVVYKPLDAGALAQMVRSALDAD